MKLHTKLILALTACLSLVIICAQFIQYQQVNKGIRTLSNSNLALLSEREEDFARNLYRSVANSVADSLNRGEMEKFSSLLQQTSEVDGLLEFSLFSRNGVVDYSSDRQFLNTSLPAEINSKINNREGFIYQMTDEAIEIYHPQKIVSDCIRCHTTWNLDDAHGGILFFRFSIESLQKARVQAEAALHDMNMTYLADAALSVMAVLVVLVITIFFLLKRMVAAPLASISSGFNQVAEGNLTTRMDIRSKDEIGSLSNNFNEFIDRLHAMVESIADQVGSLKRSSSSLHDLSSDMSDGAEDMANKSAAVASSASAMSSNMSSVASSMSEANSNINMVAASTEEMTATIDEIARNTEKARNISEKAVSETRKASAKMKSLGESAQNIGKITEAITEISEQTNLLALNATIEAARAGEAGKGFAVVASEIKELARQTASATLEISDRISEIQDDTGGAIGEIEQISKIIDDINSIISTIAAAVEEQSVATREIAGNISQASNGIDAVADNVHSSSEASDNISNDIRDVDAASTAIMDSSQKVNQNSAELAQLADLLKGLVERFKL
jgi:methyl-accepting chemotaxis protein